LPGQQRPLSKKLERTAVVDVHVRLVAVPERRDVQVRCVAVSFLPEEAVTVYAPVTFLMTSEPYTRHAFASGSCSYLGAKPVLFVRQNAKKPRDFFACAIAWRAESASACSLPQGVRRGSGRREGRT
jgi:hypothetical protein